MSLDGACLRALDSIRTNKSASIIPAGSAGIKGEALLIVSDAGRRVEGWHEKVDEQAT